MNTSGGKPLGGRYRTPAIALHWVMAALIAVLLMLGWTMTALEEDPRSQVLLAIHRSLGVIALGLVLVRILWRVRYGTPTLPHTHPAWQRVAAATTHFLLYALMLGVPLLGVLAAFFDTNGVVIFGWHLPRVTMVDNAIKESLFSLHGFLAGTLAALAGLHVAAALKHLIVDRDGVFERMSIRRQPATPGER